LSDTVPDYWDNVLNLVKVFFPQYFDPNSPNYVPPEMLDALQPIADEARPWCLSEERQNFAEAMFLAYLISVQKETSSGQGFVPYAGPITSEKEGDIAVTYATITNNEKSNMSQRPSSDPWDAWNRLWSLCQKGAITSRFGDPCRPSLTATMGSLELTWTLSNSAVGLLRLA